MKTKQNTSHINISLNTEAFQAVSQLRDRLSKEMGFKFSYSQVIQYLLKYEAKKENTNA